MFPLIQRRMSVYYAQPLNLAEISLLSKYRGIKRHSLFFKNVYSVSHIHTYIRMLGHLIHKYVRSFNYNYFIKEETEKNLSVGDIRQESDETGTPDYLTLKPIPHISLITLF